MSASRSYNASSIQATVDWVKERLPNVQIISLSFYALMFDIKVDCGRGGRIAVLMHRTLGGPSGNVPVDWPGDVWEPPLGYTIEFSLLVHRTVSLQLVWDNDGPDAEQDRAQRATQ